MSMSSNDERSAVASFLARTYAKPWTARPHTHPKMPARLWRIWAVITIAAGATFSWAVSQSAPTATIVVRTVLGGVFGLAIGMYIVETVWERRLHRRNEVPTSPIGGRR
jgi:hypothetical protein